MKVAMRRSKPTLVPAEFKIVRLRECPVDSPILDNPDQVEKFWRQLVATAPWFKTEKECLVVFLLNTKRRLIGFEMVSQGTLDTLLVNHSEVFRLAAMQSAPAIILAHNHPSGEPAPSEADIKGTRDLIRGAGVMKIDLLDHVIIGHANGKPSRCSLREHGYFDEDSEGPISISLGDEQKPVIDWIRRKHYRGRKPSDAEIAKLFCRAAFCVPEAVSDAINCYARYRDAEGLEGDDALRAMVLASHRRLKSRKRERR